jgi:hypothetical protein
MLTFLPKIFAAKLSIVGQVCKKNCVLSVKNTKGLIEKPA